MSISASLQALTGSLQDNGFGPSLAVLTGDFAGDEGGLATLRGTTEVLTGSFASLGNFDGSIEGSLEALRASILGQFVTAPALEELTGSFSGVVGTSGGIQATLSNLDGSFAGLMPVTAALAGSFEYPTASFSGGVLAVGPVAASLRQLRASFAGSPGAAGSLAGQAQPLTSAFVGYTLASGLVTMQLPRIVGAFGGAAAVSSAARTWAMNTKHNAVTEYTSFPFNSFARYNGVYLAAGASGLYLLSGDDDNGVPISWSIVTGQSDDKKSEMKRIPEILMGLRFDGALKVQVWKDDDEMYEYTLANFREGVLHQARVKPGRGLRSRYYKVGVSGTGPTLELDSLQLVTPVVARRLG